MATDDLRQSCGWKRLLALSLFGIAAIAGVAACQQRDLETDVPLLAPPGNALAACVAGQEAVFAPIDGQLPGLRQPLILSYVRGEGTQAVSLRPNALVLVDVSDPPRVQKRDSWSTAPPMRSVPVTGEFVRSLTERLQTEISWAKPAVPPTAAPRLYFYRDARGRCAWSGPSGIKGHLADWIQMFDALQAYAASDSGQNSVATNEAHLKRHLQRLAASSNPPPDLRLHVVGMVLAIGVASLLFLRYGGRGSWVSYEFLRDPKVNRHPIVLVAQSASLYFASFVVTGTLLIVHREHIPFTIEVLPLWLQAILLLLMPIPGVLCFYWIKLALRRIFRSE